MYRQPEGERNASPRVAAVLVDLDDTLFDQVRAVRGGLAKLADAFPALAEQPLDALVDSHNVMLDRMHLEVLRGDVTIDQSRRARMRRLLTDAGLTPRDTDLDVAVAAYREGYVGAWCAIDGAVPLLERLRREARIAIVSNNKRDEQVQKLQVCGLDRLVDAIVVWEDAFVAKPDPAMFRIAIERLGATAESSVVLGDSWEADVAGAAAAGIRAVWLNRRGVAAPDPYLATEIRALVPTEPVARIILGR